MPNEDESNKLELIVFAVYIIIMAFVVWFALLKGRALEEAINLKIYNFYTPALILFTVFIGLVLFTGGIRRKTKSKFLQNLKIPLFDPQYSILNNIKFLRPLIRSPINLILFFLFLFSLTGTVIYTAPQTAFTNPQTAYENVISVMGQTSFPKFSQQVTPIGQTVLGVEPASDTESIVLAVIMSLILTAIFRIGIYLGFKNFNWTIFSRNIFFGMIIIFLVLAPIGGLIWVSLHNLVYGSSDIASFSTFLFGFNSTALLFLFMSFIPMLLYHSIGVNFALALRSVVPSSDIIVVGFIVSAIAFLSLFILSYIRTKKVNAYG